MDTELSSSYNFSGREPTKSTLSSTTALAGWSYSSSSDKKRFCYCCMLPRKVGKCLEVTLLLAAIILSLLLFTIPVIVHIVKQQQPETSYQNSTNNCSELSSWRAEPRGCQSVNYNGSICSSYLTTWQGCATSTPLNTIHINSSSDLGGIENEIRSIFQLASYATEECKVVVLPFICQYGFPLCINGSIYLPSQESCFNISTNECRSQWALAKQFGKPLPDCSMLPKLKENSTTPTPSAPHNITCEEMFYESNGTCYPSCANFEDSPYSYFIAVLVIQLFAASFGLFMGIVVLIISLYRWRVMFVFPSVFLVYMTIGYCIVAFFVIISQTDRTKLYCTHTGLNESIHDPSTFCTICGVVFQYFLLSITLWWFFHVCSLFYKVMFPLTAKRFQKYEKFAHIFLLIAGILIPIPGILMGLLIPEYNYTMTTFPPILCTPKNSNFWYYTSMLPLNALLGIGVALFVVLFWIVHKHRGILHPSKSNKFQISTAETKLLCVLFYYVLFGVITLAYYGLATADQSAFINGLLQYFACESQGLPPSGVSSCNPQIYQQYNYKVFSSFTYLLMGFVPLANFIFVVNWNSVKAKLCSPTFKFYSQLKHSTTDYHSTVNSSHAANEYIDNEN